MTTVRIPVSLRSQVGDAREIAAEGQTVGQVIEHLFQQHPVLRSQLVTPDGELHRFVNVYLNGRDVRYLDALDTPVGERDTIILLPAMAGG